MKKVIFSLILFCCFVSLAACTVNTVTVSSIEVEGQKVVFAEGDEFSVGDLVVTATFSDASSADVTKKADVTNPEAMTVGKHTVVVSYDGCSAEYEITVEAMSSLKIDTTAVKVEYVAGEDVSLAGLKVSEVYASFEREADYSALSVKVLNAAEEEVEALDEAGTYTVVISNGKYEASYEIAASAKVYEDVETAIEKAIENANKVVSGTATVNNYGEETFEYLFGANHTQIKGAYDTQYFELTEGESVFGVVVSPSYDGSADVPTAYYEPTELHLKGVDFRGAVGYAFDVFGVESLVDTLYYAGVDAASFAQNVEAGVYSYSYEALIESYYYQISVEFKLDDKGEIIASVNATLNGYYFETLVYDEETDTYSLPAEVTEPDFVRTVVVSQVAGERVAENPYSLEKCAYQSFDLTDALGNTVEDGAEIAITNGSEAQLFVSNLLPESAIASIDEVKVNVYDEFGFETWSAYGSYWEGVVSLNSYTNGKYQVVIKTIAVEKHITLVVNPAELTYFAGAAYDDASWGYEEVETVKVYVGIGAELSVVVNSGADKSFTAALKEANDAVSLEVSGTTCSFFCNEPGEYEVVLTSTVNPELSDVVKVVVEPAPEVSEILNGKYGFYDWYYGQVTVEFTPAYPGALNGVVSLSAVGGMEEFSGETTYSYSPAGVYMEAINGYSVGISQSFGVEVLFNGYPQFELEKVEEVADAELVGVFNATFVHPKNGMSYSMTLVFNADGTGSYSFMNGGNEGTFEFFAANNVIEFSNVVALFGSEVLLSGSYSDAGVYGIAVIDGGEIALDYVGNQADNDEPTTSPVVGPNQVNASWYGEICTFVAEADGTYTFSVNEAEAVLGINFEMNATFTLELYAGDLVEIVVMTAQNTGAIEVVELVIELA